MAVSATRTIGINFSGTIQGNESFQAATNTVSPGQITPLTLANGDNVITVPVVTGIIPKAVTVVHTASNTVLVKVKGTTADAGIALHKTDPTSIGLDTTQASIVLNAATTGVNVILVWS